MHVAIAPASPGRNPATRKRRRTFHAEVRHG